MNKSVKMIVTLTVLGAVAGIILSFVFKMADPLIQINKEKELRAAIFTVLTEAKDYRTLEKEHKDGVATIYVGLDNNSSPIGLAFKADGNGYQGNVGVMVGLDLDYAKLKGIEILDQVETPGLGDRIREESFKEQFIGLEVSPQIEYIKYVKPEKPNQIQAITGATISSKAVVNNINKAVKKVTGLFTEDDISAEPVAPEPKKSEESGEEEEE
ncbi:MAG: RnfABCDGE type electron transport complex subunit G [Thermodesulfobacteriota bacterium]